MNRAESEARARAEIIFKAKQEQAKDAPLAVVDYKATQQKTLENMLRLRKLRMARGAS